MRAISPARIMNCRIIPTVFAAALLFAPSLAQEELDEEAFPAEPETEISPAAAAALDAAWDKLEQLVELLASVVDAESAAALAPEIGTRYSELRQADASVLDDEDMEVMAAEFEEVFLRLDAELVRLAETGCFGCAALADACRLPELSGAADEPAAEPEKRSAQPLPLDELELPAPESGTEAPLQ